MKYYEAVQTQDEYHALQERYKLCLATSLLSGSTSLMGPQGGEAGGWERLVKSVKTVIKACAGNGAPTKVECVVWS